MIAVSYKIRCPEPRTKSVNEVRNCRVDAQGRLDDGETILTAPDIVEFTRTFVNDEEVLTESSNLTISNRAVNTTVLSDHNRREVPVGKGMTFTVAGGAANSTYVLRFHFLTTGQLRKEAQVILEVVPETAPS